MIRIDTPRQLPVVHQLTVESDFGAELVGILLRRREAGHLTFAERREGVEL